MNYPKYLSLPEDSFLIYRFTSAGPKGLVQKTVTYSPTDVENVYNLGFGDYNPVTKTINDLSVTNNGDSYKVLATVASTVNFYGSISKSMDRNKWKYACKNKTISHRHQQQFFRNF
jgi:hypothetical protein